MAAARDEIARIRAAAAGARRIARARPSRAARLAVDAALTHGGLGATGPRAAGGVGTPGNPAGAVQQWFDGFAIPKNIVMCESGGNYGALNPSSGAGGAYQLLPSTYEGLGGKYEAPHLAPKSEQDRLAAKLWADGQGRGNWEC